MELEGLDTATLLSLAGSLADRVVLDELSRSGFVVRRSHGYVFQRLLAGEPTIGELAASLGITQQGASKHVAELESLGLVARKPSERDARVRVVQLTKRGREVIDAARSARAAFEQRLSDLAGEQRLRETREALVALLGDGGLEPLVHDRRIPLD